MPFSLPARRKELLELLIEDLVAALTALQDFLPEQTDKHGQILALRARLNDANKERYRNTLSPDEYQRRVDTIRAACFDLVNALEPADFELPVAGTGAASAKASAAKQGSILYRVPHRMPLRKPSICTIRVAIDEEDILQDIVLDDNVRIRPRVEVSDMMRAELLDPEGEVFSIRPLSEPEQLVREQGYTQWLFSVTPQVEGEHQLLVKVSMMEYNTQLGRYVPREVSVLETVTIVTETAVQDLEISPLKATGEQLVIGPEPAPARSLESAAPPSQPPAPAAPSPSTVFAPLPNKKAADPAPRGRSSSVRPLAIFLILLVAGSSATWAVNTQPAPAWWLASLRDNAAAYEGFKEKFKTDPRAKDKVETATFRIAEKTGKLADLREYLTEYKAGGRYLEQVVARIDTLEAREVRQLARQPEAQRILKFVRDYPESERLLEVVSAAKTRPEVLRAVQPELEAAYLKKIAPEPTETKVEQFLEQFPDPVQRRQFEQILEQNPGLKKRSKSRLEQMPERTPVREKSGLLEQNERLLSGDRRSGLTMVRVRGGTFIMGCQEGRDTDCYDDEKPAHTVTLSSFQIGKYEVTQADWRAVMGDNPSGNENCDDCPVEQVSWDDIQDFLKKLNAREPGKNYRLPTEAEWEYAARGGHKMPQDVSLMSLYAGGNDIGKVAWYKSNSGSQTHPVGQKTPNALGLYDMSGNVDEWCSDSYPEGAQTNPKGAKSGPDRVRRGGSWLNGARSCRAANRGSWHPVGRLLSLGFRLALSLQ